MRWGRAAALAGLVATLAVAGPVPARAADRAPDERRAPVVSLWLPPLPPPWLGLHRTVRPPPVPATALRTRLWPRPVFVDGRLRPGYVAVGRASLFGAGGTKLKVWVQGAHPALGPEAGPAPDVRLTLRRTGVGAGRLAGAVPWRLEVRAQRLSAPYEGSVRAGVGHQGRHHAVDVAFAALDVELPPLLAPSMLATRKLRRSGFVLHGQLGRLRRGGLRPLLDTGGSGARDGVRLRAVAHLWLRRVQQPALDTRLTFDARWTLRRHSLPVGHAWARAALRTVRGGGGEQPVVRVGGWAPGQGGAPGPDHLLHEAILGHEDLARYANQVVQGELGALWAPTRGWRTGGFVSAAQMQPGPGRPGRALHAVGGIVQVASPLRQLPVALTYQVARRAGSGHGAWLHLLTVGA